MTKLRRLLRNVPVPRFAVPRFGAAAVIAGALIVAFRGVESRSLP
jgi:hypothetical protein